MIKLTATLETFLINKGFVRSYHKASDSIPELSEWNKDRLTVYVFSDENESGGYVVLVRKLKAESDEALFTSNFTLYETKDIIHLESFLNSHLLSDPWLSRDK